MTVVHSADQVIGSIPTEQAALSVADILDRAAARLEGPGAWTQGTFARDGDGVAFGEEEPRDRPAVCWCALGAIAEEAGRDPWAARWSDGPLGEARRYLIAVVGTVSVPSFNDEPGRTQAEVVAALRAAAEKARTASAVGIAAGDEPSTPAVSS